MKKLLSLLLALVMLLSVTALGSADAVAADTVVYGTIFTADETNSRVEAMAIKDGVIVYSGDKDGAQAYVGDSTAVADYTGSFITPGFIDGHCHIYVDAENQTGFILSTCKEQTQEAYLDMIKTYIADHPGESIYKGFGWLDSAFVGGTPTTEMLDAICPDTPIYIKSEDCHSCWVNTAMLKLTGVTAETADPVGGVIEHYENGEPNGCFRDTAMDYLVKPYVPSYTTEQYESILLDAQAKMLSNGYTAWNDVIIDPQSAANICEAYYNLDKAGKLTAKVNVSILVNNTEDYVAKLDEAIALHDKYSDGTNFAITDIKIFMDGIVESETAYVSEPYADGKTGADRWPTEEDTQRLYDLTKRINDAGLVAHFHAIGDAAITKALDAIAYAKENSVNKDIRNCMTHFQMISASDIQRMKDLDVIAVANLGWAPSADESVGNPNVEKLNVGEERNNAMYPFKSMLNAGIKMSYATDYPAGPVLDTIYNIEAGITRQILNYSSTLRNADECLTPDEVLDCLTRGGAYQLGREASIGTLTVGMSADFVVLNQDVTDIDPLTIYSSTKVQYTYVAGNIGYSIK